MPIENEMAKVTYQPIPEDELISYQIRLKGDIFKQIRKRLAFLKSIGFVQRNLATKLNIDPGQLSRQLSGESDLRLETLSDLARGLDCRIHVFLAPICAHISDRMVDHPTAEMYAIGYFSPKPNQFNLRQLLVHQNAFIAGPMLNVPEGHVGANIGSTWESAVVVRTDATQRMYHFSVTMPPTLETLSVSSHGE